MLQWMRLGEKKYENSEAKNDTKQTIKEKINQKEKLLNYYGLKSCSMNIVHNAKCSKR